MTVLKIQQSHLRFPKIQFDLEHSASHFPDWAKWACKFGHELKSELNELRSGLIVITTPCQSPLGGIIGLGFLVAELEKKIERRDIDSYFEFLYSLPGGTKVKYNDPKGATPKTFMLLRTRTPGVEIKMRQVGGRGQSRTTRRSSYLPKNKCLDYVLENEAESQATGNDALTDYSAIPLLEFMSDKIPHDQNWRSNLDSIVIAGPTAGLSSPRKQLENTVLSSNEESQFSLARILGVKEWKENRDQSPHYCRFFNTPKAQKDLPEILAESKLVVFTSASSLIRYSSRFKRQLKVLVVSRDIGDSMTESLDDHLWRHRKESDLPSSQLTDKFEKPPNGIQVLFYGHEVREVPGW